MTAKYRLIADTFRHRIQSGMLPPGTRLPSDRELAALWGVDRRTVIRALDVLRDERLVVTEHGKGTFVPDTPEPVTARDKVHRRFCRDSRCILDTPHAGQACMDLDFLLLRVEEEAVRAARGG
jgi:DNA-binding FadR family transcriptional regulator